MNAGAECDRILRRKRDLKILFIFTGGTIGSTDEGGVRSVDGGKPYKIIEAYRGRFGIDFEYDVAEPFCELSENLTGEHIKEIVRAVKAGLALDYDGIILSHGTDTLQYSAAAIGFALGQNTAPVCIISANAPIESEMSNGLINLRAAVEFIRCGAGRGVFSIYANCDKILAHRGTRLAPPIPFSDRAESIFEAEYGSFDGKLLFTKNPKYKEASDKILPLSAEGLSCAAEDILVLTPYVGMRYPDLYGVKYVIMNTYHSGTLDVKSAAAREFYRLARECGARVFAVGVLEGLDYSSTAEYSELGILPLKNISPIAAYMKLWLLSSAGRSPEELLLPLSGDL